MYSRIVVICGTLVLGLGWTASIAHAQHAADDNAESGALARARLEEADRAYREGRYRDAITAYLAADRLEPNPALQLALGKSYEQLNETSRALASYREYFNRAPHAGDRAHVQERVTALARQLAQRGVQQVSISSVPVGASVLIDDKELGVTPIYVDLTPGQHHLEFRYKGYTSAGLDFELAAEQPLNVMTTLVPARASDASSVPVAATVAVESEPAAPMLAPKVETAPPPPPATTDQKPSGGAGSTYRTIGFAALGTSVVALGVAMTFELMRSHSESLAKQEDEQIAFKETLDTMEAQQTWAQVFAITAGVLAATGGILLLLASQSSESPPNPGGVALACTATECSALYRRVF